MSKPKNDGGPAFPKSLVDNQGRIDNSNDFAMCGGISIRDYFAAAAMQALITNEKAYMATGQCANDKGVKVTEMSANAAYDYADAMLAERLKP